MTVLAGDTLSIELDVVLALNVLCSEDLQLNLNFQLYRLKFETIPTRDQLLDDNFTYVNLVEIVFGADVPAELSSFFLKDFLDHERFVVHENCVSADFFGRSVLWLRDPVILTSAKQVLRHFHHLNVRLFSFVESLLHCFLLFFLRVLE